MGVDALVDVLLMGRLDRTGVILVGGFGAAALLYLVTEELLVEAHETAEAPFLTMLFFLGFIVVYPIDLR